MTSKNIFTTAKESKRHAKKMKKTQGTISNVFSQQLSQLKTQPDSERLSKFELKSRYNRKLKWTIKTLQIKNENEYMQNWQKTELKDNKIYWKYEKIKTNLFSKKENCPCPS